jgi:hypothetical protein
VTEEKTEEGKLTTVKDLISWIKYKIYLL